MIRNLLAIATLAVTAAPSLTYAERQLPPDGAFTQTLLPRHRVRLAGAHFQSEENETFERTTTATLLAEYAYASWGSVYFDVPVTRKDDSIDGDRSHLDNIATGGRFGLRWRDFYGAAGVEIEWPTGNDARGIGSNRLGRFESRLGLSWSPGPVYITTAIRGNVQTNSRFRETEEETFDRAWVWEAEAGLVFDGFDVFAEFQRKMRFAPKERRLFSTQVAPGLRFKIEDDFALSVAAPVSIASEQEYEHGVSVQATFYP